MEKNNLNALDNDMRCTRCGKCVDELIPFDLKDSSYSGCKLIKQFREVDMVDYNEACEKIINEFSNGKEIDELNKIYGSDNVQSAILYESLIGNLESSWECKDCINDEGPYKHYRDQ